MVNVQYFLMLHRLHELRVLPDTVDMYASVDCVPSAFPTTDDDFDPIYNRKLFLSEDVGIPDPDKEAVNISDELKSKLKEF